MTMRILKIIPGSGEGFLCENCLRDQSLITKLCEQGHEVTVVPIYLPMPDAPGCAAPPVQPFYGAVRVYLEHRFPFFRRAPQWIKRWLDSPRVLRMAGRRSATSSSRKLGGLTLSMLRGEHGGQAAELDALCDWIRDTQEKPDIIHLSNALLLGMVRRLNATLNVPVVCSLQDEDTWIDAMPAPTATLIWAEIRDRVADVAGLITVSRYYADKILPRLTGTAAALPPVRVVHPGIDVPHDGGRASPRAEQTPPLWWNVLLDPDGFEALDLILRAFTRARQSPSCGNLHLHCSGVTRSVSGHSPSRCRRLGKHGLRQCVRFSPQMLDAEERLAFIRSSALFTVLHRNAAAFDLSVLEAMACGVPVLQPDAGANPEILALAEGGAMFEPGNAEALSKRVVSFFDDPSRLAVCAQRGRQGVAQHFSAARMAQETLAAYESYAV